MPEGIREATYRSDPVAFLSLQLLQLRRHREFLAKLSAEGDVAFVIAMSAEPGTTLKFEPALLRQLTDLGLRLEFEL